MLNKSENRNVELDALRAKKLELIHAITGIDISGAAAAAIDTAFDNQKRKHPEIGVALADWQITRGKEIPGYAEKTK